jgi:AraC-like DNA-binding protein
MPIPRSVLDTSLLPQQQRVPLWRDSATSLWDVSAITSDTFYARVDAFQAADLVFGTVASSSQITERVGSRIAADSLDYYMLQVYAKGERRSTGRRQEETVGRGDVLVVDMTQPIKTTSTAYQSFDLVMPRRVFDPLLANPDDHGSRRLAANLPLTRLLRSHLLALYRAGPGMSEADAAAMQGPTLALAAAALNGVVSEELAAPARRATWLAVRDYIESHLTDLSMSVEHVAIVFSISRATLYRIMDPVEGFVSYVRQRRLFRCREDLTHPRHRSRAIGEIAALWGFQNASAFSTLFLRTFGISPRDYRKNAFGNVKNTHRIGSEIAWSRWLAAMR